MTYWRRNRELLLETSEPLIRTLFAENKARGDVLSAIGYVYEFGRGQLCFNLCANTARNAKESLAGFLARWPNATEDEFRWNSGDYDYPGAAQGCCGSWSRAWMDELRRLDRLAENKAQAETIHDHVAEICCEVLAELATRAVFGDWSVIDFNVAALLDDVDEVKKRDRRIRELIRPAAEPGAAGEPARQSGSSG